MKGARIWSSRSLTKAPERLWNNPIKKTERVRSERAGVKDNVKLNHQTSLPTYHRFSFLVKEGYFVALPLTLPLRAATSTAGGKYLGKTCSVKTSGRIITNERPCGNQDTMSDRLVSLRMANNRCGKISRCCAAGAFAAGEVGARGGLLVFDALRLFFFLCVFLLVICGCGGACLGDESSSSLTTEVERSRADVVAAAVVAVRKP